LFCSVVVSKFFCVREFQARQLAALGCLALLCSAALDTNPQPQQSIMASHPPHNTPAIPAAGTVTHAAGVPVAAAALPGSATASGASSAAAGQQPPRLVFGSLEGALRAQGASATTAMAATSAAPPLLPHPGATAVAPGRPPPVSFNNRTALLSSAHVLSSAEAAAQPTKVRQGKHANNANQPLHRATHVAAALLLGMDV
jgi:hypothetical protein